MPQSKSITYLIPGMGANEKLFYHQKSLPFDKVVLTWLDPLPGEVISDYAKRYLPMIDQNRPVNIIAVSFGGVLAHELALLIKVERLILVSSIRSAKELPPAMQFFRRFPLHRLMPTRKPPLNRTIISNMFGIREEKDIDFFVAMIEGFNFRYIKWAIRQLIEWQRKTEIPGVIRIMGDKDRIFNRKPHKNDLVIKGGTHYMIVNRAPEINKLLTEIITGSADDASFPAG